MGALAWNDANFIHTNVAAEISALTDKATPVDADVFLGENSAAGTAFSKIKVTFANLKTTLANTFLLLSGGTMTGDIQLGETDIKLDAALSGDETWSMFLVIV